MKKRRVVFAHYLDKYGIQKQEIFNKFIKANTPKDAEQIAMSMNKSLLSIDEVRIYCPKGKTNL